MILDFNYNHTKGKVYCQRNNGRKIELEKLNELIVWYVLIWMLKEGVNLIRKKYPTGLVITWDKEPVTSHELKNKILNATKNNFFPGGTNGTI